MKSCPKCGEEIEDSSVFCHNCGSKLESMPVDIVKNEVSNILSNDGSFEDKKTNAMIIFGYLTILIEIVAILGCWSQLKVINADRVVLYPLLAVMLSYFTVFKLLKYERSYTHAMIIGIVSVILFILGIVAL